MPLFAKLFRVEMREGLEGLQYFKDLDSFQKTEDDGSYRRRRT
jgi:hypothetical protein